MMQGGAVGGVFISYRSEDSHSYAALIYAELSRRFGADLVFLDSESTAAGEDFGEVLLGRLRQCRVLVVVIGQRWLTAADNAGRRRIDSAEDWVHRELVEAFRHGLRVIPILTEGVEIPAEADLPADVAALHRRQALRLHHRNTSHDLARLVEELTRLEPELAEAAQHHRQGVNPVPQQLPPAPRMFAARHEDLTRLTAALDETAETDRTVVISAIAGQGESGRPGWPCTGRTSTWIGFRMDRCLSTCGGSIRPGSRCPLRWRCGGSWTPSVLIPAAFRWTWMRRRGYIEVW
jgi:TIR domain